MPDLPIDSIANFKEFLRESVAEIERLENENEILNRSESDIKKILASDFSYLMFYDDEEKLYNIPTLDKSHDVCKNKPSVMQEAIKQRHPLMLNEVEKSLLYEEGCDNLLEEDIKELILLPASIKTNRNLPPEIIIWAALSNKSSSTFEQKRVLYLLKYLEAVKLFLLKSKIRNKDYHRIGLKECLESKESLEYRIKRNEQYFHSIIHDIRTPMNALLGFLDLLSTNERDQNKLEYLDMAQKSGEQMIRLISDALDMAKIASGNLSINQVDFRPAGEFDDTIKIFYETARRKKVSLSAYVDPSLPEYIKTDPYRIKQILSNLLSNAIKFTPQNGRIGIDVIYNKDQDTVTFSVKDSGIGISKEGQENIFLPYRQEKSNTESNYGGTGLGLSISQQISVLLGGKLELESEEGSGSRFYFTIPANTVDRTKYSFDKEILKKKSILFYKCDLSECSEIAIILKYLEAFGQDIHIAKRNDTISSLRSREFDILIVTPDRLNDEAEDIQILLDETETHVWFIEDVFDQEYRWFHGNRHKVSLPIIGSDIYTLLQPEKKSQTVELENSTKKSKNLTGKRVLIVDDNRINLKFMQELLKRMGTTTVVAEDAETALEEIEKEVFDIIFMDENMPKMLGSEAIAQIRKSEKKNNEDPAIVISLSGDSEHEKRIREAGANEVLTKPVHVKVIEEVLSKYFNA